MDYTVCRAITFINYNMPIRDGEDIWEGYEKYCTTGFFDCMYTKRVSCLYKDEQLQELWNYGIGCITKGEGRYAHQNVFCFSQDNWNSNITDETFWASNKYEDMLLIFVVFVQTRDYITDVNGMEKQCKRFNIAAQEQLGDEGYVYTYGTVDKNDFVVCIRSKKYKKAVDAIMKLHAAGCSIVYSYSVFGIAEARQQRINDDEYMQLNLQRIDSISLKGVTNSIKPDEGMAYSLDQKYYNFCIRLVDELYKNDDNSEGKPDFKIYDILGDNDFRLIARMVPLGNLIRQFGKKGLLSYYGNATQFTFFSTHLVLNTRDLVKESRMPFLGDSEISKANRLLQLQYKTEWCTRLKVEMDDVMRQLKNRCKEKQYIEKLIPACYGIYQLLQSLTALEAAPTKKYDFYSIYYPLEVLVHILREGCSKEGEDEALAENGRLYEFVHKISMTLHGTLRTDIQFFQIRDFNATLHYAPAKLRAYYTMFVFMISAHIKEVSSEPLKRHSYIFCPGMFKGVGVRQLFRRPTDEKRLMLISVPERYLYFPKNLSIILAHEVGHLAGEQLRKRKVRHETFLKCSYRILCLELTKLIVNKFTKEADINCSMRNRLRFEDLDLYNALLRENARLEDSERDTAHMYYSESSIHRIVLSYKNVCELYEAMCCVKYSRLLFQEDWKRCKKNVGETNEEYVSSVKNMRSKFLFCESLADDMKKRFELYREDMLRDLLYQFHYLLSEPVSDILAILILGLEPYEYLYSIADERKANRVDEQFSRGLTKVRIALVVHVMEQLLKEDKHGKAGYLLGYWQDVYKQVGSSSNVSEPMVRDLLLEAYKYIKKDLRDKQTQIQNYQSPIDQEKNILKVKRYDYLNDLEIFEAMSKYLLVCGREYVCQILDNSKCKTSRAIVQESFRKCAGDTAIGLMEQIDVFLHRFENEWKNEYFPSVDI